MSFLAWTGIAIFVLFILYFIIFRWRGPRKSRPLTRVQPRPYQRYDEDIDLTRERRRKAIVQDDATDTDDILIGAGLLGSLNSEDHHVESHRPHYSDVPTPDPEPTSIGGTSHFETGGGFGGDSGFNSGSGDFGGSDSGGSSGGDSGGGSND